MNQSQRKEPFFIIPLPLIAGLTVIGYIVATRLTRTVTRINARSLAIPYLEWKMKAKNGDQSASRKLELANKRLAMIHHSADLQDEDAINFLKELNDKYNITKSDYLENSK